MAVLAYLTGWARKLYINPFLGWHQNKTKCLTTPWSLHSRFCLLTQTSTLASILLQALLEILATSMPLLQTWLLPHKGLNRNASHKVAFSISQMCHFLLGLVCSLSWEYCSLACLPHTHSSNHFSQKPSLTQGWVRYSITKHWSYLFDHCLFALSVKL